MVKMHYLVCYDITEDEIRFFVSSVCKDYGLERIQYSVFYGKLAKNQLREMKIRVNEGIKKTNSNVHFIPVCAKCEGDHIVLSSVMLKPEDKQKNVSVNAYQDINEEMEFEGGILIL